MNRSDRKIALAAILVGVIALAVLFLMDEHEERATAQHHTSAQRVPPAASPVRRQEPLPQRQVEQFPFDPNTADSMQLIRLGLQSWQVRNIYKYRARGGVYRTKEDFASLYGLTVKDYRRLEPYIRISADYRPAAEVVDRRRPERDTLRYPVKISDTAHVVLNIADTTQLKRVPGIGSYYAREIVRYGQRLGGYVHVDQLDEVEGFPQSSKRYFVIDRPEPRKLAVNHLTLAELRRHPYINYHQAKAIVDYRRLHGKLTSLQELRLCRDFPPEAIQRLEPYIAY